MSLEQSSGNPSILIARLRSESMEELEILIGETWVFALNGCESD
jgi:hypothetical protein